MATVTKQLATIDMVQAGQSPWLDNISRSLISSGKLQKLIEKKGLRGVTSNPSIFQKAISNPRAGYEQDIQKFIKKGYSALEIYDALTIADIKATCDLFLPTYIETKGDDGFVSLEVLPGLAHDTEGTVLEAKRLFKAVGRPNVMIKIPATPEGIPAIQTVISEGINVNVTLIFSLSHYQAVAKAYINGLEERVKKGKKIDNINSVASVFVSRFDTYVDDRIDQLKSEIKDAEKREFAESLKGKAAVANSKIIYQEFKGLFGDSTFEKLEKKGARIQKVLWGSTSVKNPKYAELLYVEPLIGKNTVNTLPQPTFDAVVEHGDIEANTIEEDLEEAREAITHLQGLDINLLEVGDHLQHVGVKQFKDAFDSLMGTLETAHEKVASKKGRQIKPASVKVSLGSKDYQEKVTAALRKMEEENFRVRFLKRDPTLWKKNPSHQKVINNRLGWMQAHDWAMDKLYELDRLAEEITQEKVKDVVLLGMGGSSLAPEVMSLICKRNSTVKFYVMDTTDPSTLLNAAKKIRMKSALFIVASKSGGTIETMSQFYYFYEQVQKAFGKKVPLEKIGRHFIAITDDGSGLEKMAEELCFRETFINPTDIGGRFSALSFFGLVPAALIGIDVRKLLRTARMCFDYTSTKHSLLSNPGFYLGAVLSTLAKEGRDKMAFFSTKSLDSFGVWAEQLVAESTGKEGKGIIPVEGAAPIDPKFYGDDRVSVFLKLKGDPTTSLTKVIQAHTKAGIPVIEIEWANSASIGESFLLWEVITAIGSALLGVNPFDEPNVTESKDITKELIAQFEKTGKLPNPENVIKKAKDLEKYFGKVKKGQYVAILAYTERTPATQKAFNAFRSKLSKKLRVPVIVGFGPRYLHSIGQLYKGGPKTGIFLEVIKKETVDAKVPGKKYKLGQLKMAQAMGDFKAIANKGLPVCTFDAGKDVLAGLKKLETFLDVL